VKTLAQLTIEKDQSMFTEQQFAALSNYDTNANPEGLDLEQLKPVKEFSVVDVSSNAICYRTSSGELQAVERKLVSPKISINTGDKIVLNSTMNVVSIGSKSIDELAAATSKRSGSAATNGSNERKSSSIM